jgi:radical SAM protein with 4Fe4S-binding SPASM domain
MTDGPPFEGFPFIVGWELTLACNLLCRHCGSSAGSPRANELSTGEALRICDQLPDLLVQEVNFTGGEPLLRPDWSKLAGRLRAKGIEVKVLTNGLAVDTTVASQLLDTGVSGVGVSLDGLEPTHDRIRSRNGSHRSAIAAIEMLQTADLPVTVITTVNGVNILELPQLLTLLSKVGVTRWQIQPIFPLGRSRETAELALTEDAYLELGRFAADARGRTGRTGVEVLPGDSFGYFSSLDDRVPPWRGCPAGVFSCGITSDGKVKPCLSLPDELIVGDLRVDDLWTVWFDQRTFVETRSPAPAPTGSPCHGCDKEVDCHGGCSAMSWGSSGTLHADPYCFHRLLGLGG